MNTPKVAAALNTISLAFGELAEALSEPVHLTSANNLLERIEAAPVAPQAPVTAHEASPFVDLPDESLDPRPHGSLAQCPSHKASYLSGKYGKYCPAKSDDPAWANRKGYCTITPETAVDWLRVTAA